MAHLIKIDRKRNMARFYGVQIGQDLFGRWTVTTSWGRLGKDGRQRHRSYDTEAEAIDQAEKIEATKARRGYTRK